MRSRVLRRGCRAAHLLAALLLLLAPPDAAAQEAPEPLRFRTRAIELTVSGRLQTLFSTTSAAEAPLTLWEIRRARIEFDVRAHPLVSARVQPEFSGGTPLVRDAYVRLHLSPAFEVLAGRAFRPFGLIAQTSSRVMLPIERGAVIRGIAERAFDHHNLLTTLGYAERDTGLQLLGSVAELPGRPSYAVGFTNGPLQARLGDRSAFQLSGRIRVQPLDGVRLGAGWSRRDFSDLRGEDGRVLDLRSGQAWEVDLEYGAFAPGPHLLAEVAVGDADPFLGSRFTAAQLWLAYRTRSLAPRVAHLEPVLRVSHAEHDPLLIRGVGGTLVTPGINLYFDPLNRVMLNYDLWRPAGEGRRESSAKLMFQLAF